MSSPPETLAAGTLLAGKLRVVRPLGAGGMGAVYEIEHEITKHRRALKVLHSDVLQLPGAVERFLREASAAGRIGDPHIVETFDAGTLEGGEPYVVLELLAGETLAERIAREGRLDVEAALDVVAQACEGVEAAHAAGIVHRDLKPDNIFLLPRPVGPPFVKLLDFGISKFDAERTGAAALTGDGAALGTPLYMSPEQVRALSDVDGRADVYALGLILYECLTGQPPFEATTLPQLMLHIHEGTVIPIEARRPELPAALCKLVARAMATEREQRVPTARALRSAILAVQASLMAPDAFADTAPERDGPVAGASPAPAPSPSPASPVVDFRETAAPASTVAPPPPRRAPSDAPAAASAPSGPPAAIAAPARPRGGSAALLVAAGALAVAGAIVATRPGQSSPAAPTASIAASIAPAPTVEPVAPRVEPAPPPAAPTATPEPAAPAVSSHAERPLPRAETPAPPAAKPPPGRPPAQNRADQAGLAKSPFR